MVSIKPLREVPYQCFWDCQGLESIVNVLFKACIIESFGSGFERTFSACREHHIEYTYEDTMTGFRITFFRQHGQNNVQDMSRTENTVYELLKENDAMTLRELAAALSRTEKTAARAIKALKEKGLIQREGSNHNGYWKILQ